MAGLPAAVQQQHRRPLLAEHVGDQAVAGRAGEDRGRGLDLRFMGARSRNCSTPALNTLSPTASMWSRPGISSAWAPGMSAASVVRGAGDRVLGADRDQHRNADGGGLLARERLARAADAGRERLQVAAGLLREGAERAALRIGHRSERRRLQRVGDALRQADAVDQMDAEAAENGGADALPGAAGQERGDARAHRIAHDVGARDPEVIHQRRALLRHRSV